MKKKLPLRTLLGYGAAGLGDNGCFSFVNSFLLFFFTSIVGLPNVAAGLITTVGTIWDSALSPIVGYASDHSKNPKGRRRPFIQKGSLALLFSTVLLFYAVPGPMPLRIVYYSALLILFWTGFSIFFVPFLALGAELTDDYDERTHLRAYTSFFNMLGGIVGTVAPTAVVALLVSFGATRKTSWFCAGIMVALLSFASIRYMLYETGKIRPQKPVQSDGEPAAGLNPVKVILEYFEVLRLKPMKFLAFGSVAYLAAYTFISTCRIYYATYNLNLSDDTIVILYLMVSGLGLVCIPLVRWLSVPLEKQRCYIALSIVALFGCVYFGIAGIESLGGLFVYLVLLAPSNSAYWQLFPSMIYDICEVDAFVCGRRREGVVVSLQSFVEALSGALTILTLGFILDGSGFVGTAPSQTAEALVGIHRAFTFIPAAMMLISIFAIVRYPLDKTRFNLLKEQLAKRDAGEPFSTGGLDKIL
jgi:GPH family glycoside/pentoside/hexuronide:cation symporter